MSLIRTNLSVSELIKNYAKGDIAIPEIQRDFVWRGDRIKLLLDSIYNDYPSGAIILWQPNGFKKEDLSILIRPERLHLYKKKMPKYLLLDGQQRLTALASVILHEDEVQTSLGEEIELPYIVINVKTLKLEVRKQKDRLSINEILLNKVLSEESEDSGIAHVLMELKDRKGITLQDKNDLKEFRQKILDYIYPVQILESDKYETVSTIFQRVNKQGKPLVTAEIELANIIPYWRGISRRLREFIRKMRNKGFPIDLPFVMRSLSAVANDSARIDEFSKRIKKEDYSHKELDKYLERTFIAIEKLHKYLTEFFIDRPEYITTRNSLVPIVYTIARSGNSKAIKKSTYIKYLLYSMFSGHYGEQSEGVLKKDFAILTNDRRNLKSNFELLLKKVIRDELSGTRFVADDFAEPFTKNPGVLIMYLALRYNGATDFSDENKKTPELSHLGKIQLHHIYPYDYMMNSEEGLALRKKWKLTKQELKSDVNDIANITFISVEANEKIKNKSPFQYLEKFATEENLEKHCIPLDKKLWKPENYFEFLDARRKLLAKATNNYFRMLQ